MGDFSSNLEGYLGSKCMSAGKDQVEERKDRKIELNVGSEALKDDGGKDQVPSSPPTKSNKEKMDIDMEKNNEGNVLLMKEQSPSKEKEEESKEKQDANTDIQVNNTTIDVAIRTEEDTREETHHVKLSFLHTTKIKVKAFLQADSWLYNKIMVLKEKVGVIQKELNHERVMKANVENLVDNIPDKLKDYELEFHQLIQESG